MSKYDGELVTEMIIVQSVDTKYLESVIVDSDL